MESREPLNLDGGKIIFIFTVFKLRFSISLHYVYRQQIDLLLDSLIH